MKKEITIQDKAELAMKSAIRQVVEEHKKSGAAFSRVEKR